MTNRMAAASSLVIVMAVTVLAYYPGLRGGYIFDDFPNIVDNAEVHLTHLNLSAFVSAALSSPSSAFYRPLPSVSFGLDWYFFGGSALAMKATNLVIHLANGLLLFALLNTLFKLESRWLVISLRENRNHLFLSITLTSAWLLSPINLTAVLYIVQRMESLCQTFVLLGLWMYLSGRSDILSATNRRENNAAFAKAGLGLIFGTVFGLLCKESAALLPVYAVLVEMAILKFRNHEGNSDPRIFALFSLILVLPLTIGLCWLVPHMMSAEAWSARTFNLAQRLLTEQRVLVSYMGLIVVPDLRDFGLYHDDIAISHGLLSPPTTVMSFLFLLILFASAVALRRTRPLFCLGILWFFAAHLLTATVVPLELSYEHRNYFASIGLLLALFSLILHGRNAGKFVGVRRVAVCAFLVLSAGVTRLRAEEWSNPVRLALAEAERHPNSPRAGYSAAHWLLALSDFHPSTNLNLALDYLHQTSLLPNASILADHALIVISERADIGDAEANWRNLQAKLESRPAGEEDIGALVALTKCRAKSTCSFDVALLRQAFATAMSKSVPTARMLAAFADFQSILSNDQEGAERALQEAILLAPNNPEYRIGLAKVYATDGKIAQSREQTIALARLNRFGYLDETLSALNRVIDVQESSPTAKGAR